MNLSYRSPHFDARRDDIVDMLVLHYTDMRSGKAALDHLCSEESRVSAHYVVGEDGEVYALVDEDKRAWHAGESYWRGHTNVNGRSIGIEIVNPGHTNGYRAFPEPQMQALIALCHEIIARHAIPARNVVGHSDVAFLRKKDPGELFDWPRLARAAIGVFPFGARPMLGSGQQRGDHGKNVIRLQTALHNWGYGLKLDGDYGAKTEQCVVAFQRHYRPGNLDGAWDDECAGLLAALHGMV
ncbi:MAG: N-acetylmuramoyl-L-alanine amidase [Alphaproteobacteria bacterium]|nr:N-acetylmuramoyl-L-alanine amidase [Alphaproteobacteria bacterium]